ncbi:MAG: type I 3-dehydroquinate dehydratase [Roseburia sp.]
MKELRIKNRTIGRGRPLVCVPVMESSSEEVIREIAYLGQSRADMIEWRVDAFEAFDDCNAIREVLEAAAPVMGDKLFLYTFRTKKQGGEAEVDAETLANLHDLAAESGCVDLVDVEYFEEMHPARKIKALREKGIRVIASHHDFEGTPQKEVMRMLLEQMCAGGADIVKLAAMPKNRADVLALLRVTSDFSEEYPGTPIITMSMGKLGNTSRLCGETFGSCVTFGVHERSSAPGQYEMNTLLGILDAIHKSNGGES